MTAPRWTEWRKVKDLPSAPVNAKTHDLPGIVLAIKRRRFAATVLIDERTGALVDGHGRRDALMTMAEAGDTPPDGIVVDVDGDWTTLVLRGWASADTRSPA